MPARVRADGHYGNWRMSKKNRHKQADRPSQCMLFTFYVLQFYCVPAIEYTKYNTRPAYSNSGCGSRKKRRIFTFNLSLFITANSMKCASNCPASCKLNIYKKFHVHFVHISAFICLVALFPSLSLSLTSYLIAHIFPIFRVNDTFPSLKMNVDGARVRSERWLNIAVLPSFCVWMIQCIHELATGVHDNKSKWNFYLTNHKRLRFIGAEKYSRQTKRRTPFRFVLKYFCAYFGVFFLSLWFMRSNLILFSQFSSNSMCVFVCVVLSP